MPEKKDLTEEQKQLYRKTPVPHKFCPNCGTRNEADADRCVNCNKDISWMKVPEPVPYDTAPPKPPESLPKSQKIFTWKAVLVFVLIILLVAALVIVLVLAGSDNDKKPESSFRRLSSNHGFVLVRDDANSGRRTAQSGQVARPILSVPNLQPLRAL